MEEVGHLRTEPITLGAGTACLADHDLEWRAGFPRTLGEFRAMGVRTAGSECQDDELILRVDDLGTACEAAQGEAAHVVEERCRRDESH